MKAEWGKPSAEKIKQLADDLKKAADEMLAAAQDRANRLVEMRKLIKERGRIAQWKKERDGK